MSKTKYLERTYGGKWKYEGYFWKCDDNIRYVNRVMFLAIILLGTLCISLMENHQKKLFTFLVRKNLGET